MRRPARWVVALAGGLLAFALFAAYHFGPWLTNERGIVVSTPVGFPVGEPAELPLRPDAPVCLTEVGVATEVERAVFGVRTRGRPATPVRFTLAARGYRSSGTVTDYADGSTPSVRVTPPERDVLARACFSNEGRQTVWLVATGDVRAASIQTDTLVGGELAPIDVSLRFDEIETRSIVTHASDGFERLALWKPGVVGAPLLWALAVLLLVGVPVAGVAAYALSLRDD